MTVAKAGLTPVVFVGHNSEIHQKNWQQMTTPYTDIKDVYINGEWRPTLEVLKEPIINPATEQVIAQAPLATAKDAELAIAAARNAVDLGPWAKLPMR
ncbi:MAG: aldehyde dehydrogenase family protein, partial [Rhodospirillaceae bacterium]|nr:aldehyde dehydrogenase family protein [Rhodospirillaceae bacterium]